MDADEATPGTARPRPAWAVGAAQDTTAGRRLTTFAALPTCPARRLATLSPYERRCQPRRLLARIRIDTARTAIETERRDVHSWLGQFSVVLSPFVLKPHHFEFAPVLHRRLDLVNRGTEVTLIATGRLLSRSPTARSRSTSTLGQRPQVPSTSDSISRWRTSGELRPRSSLRCSSTSVR